MSSGRYYRIKRLRKSVNLFTADTYDRVCSDILWANIEPGVKKNVIVKHGKNQMAGVGSLITEVMKDNYINGATYGKYNGLNTKTRFKFGSKEDARKAHEIINKMVNDKVMRDRVQTDGTATTDAGIKIKVDLVQDANGNVGLKEGSNYIPTSGTGEAVQPKQSGVNIWIIVAACVAVAAIAVALIVKFRKKR